MSPSIAAQTTIAISILYTSYIIHTRSPLMASPLPSTSKHLSTIPLVVVAITVIFVLLPSPASAMPIAPLLPAPSLAPEPPSSGMSRKVIFDIVFGLIFSVLAIGAFLCVASRKPFTGVIDRMCAASGSLQQNLLPFRITTFFARAGNAIAGVNDASVPSTRNRSGGVRSVPTTFHQTTLQRFAIPALDPDPQMGPNASV
ncbi:hypothetical protein BJY52DRAFT_1189727 [Lactarius psammicola]|nr:hypothetical protein BJY52DRAFT_1189727 [Lactarius psammicola]